MIWTILPRMRPAPGMHVEWVDGEAVVLNPQTSRLHYLNPSAALLYALILEHGYVQALKRLERLPKETDMDNEVPTLVREMIDAGLLIDD